MSRETLNEILSTPTWEEIHRDLLALKAKAQAHCLAHRKTNHFSLAVAGLSDALSDLSVEFEEELPTVSDANTRLWATTSRSV